MRPWHVRAARDGALLVAGWFGGGILLDPDGPSPVKLFSAGGDEAMFIRLLADGALDWALGGRRTGRRRRVRPRGGAGRDDVRCR